MSTEVTNFIFDLGSELEDVRINACRVLARIGDAFAMEALREAVRDESPAVRYFAGKALRTIDQRVPSEEVPPEDKEDSRLPEETPPAAVRPEPASKPEFELARTPPASPLEKFTSVLEHEEETVRARAVDRALKTAEVLGKNRVFKLLLVRLKKEKSLFVFPALVKSIGRLGDHRSIPLLKRYLDHDDPRIRANTIEALMHLGTDDIYPLIVPLLNDPDHRVKANAARGLSSYQNVYALKAVKEMLAAPQVEKRDSAAFALGHIPGKESVDLLVSLIRTEQIYSICLKAAKSLERIGNEEIIPQVNGLLDATEDPRKKRIIRCLLHKLQGEHADWQDFIDPEVPYDTGAEHREITGTVESLQHEKQAAEFYDQGIQAMGEGKLDRAVDLLQTIERDMPESTWAPIARYMIEAFREQDAFPEVRELLPEFHEVREMLPAASDGATSDEAPKAPAAPEKENVVVTVERLLRDLSESDPDVRNNAVLKLMSIDDPRAIKPLTVAAMDPDNVTRYFAKKALRRFQDVEGNKSLFTSEQTRVIKKGIVELVGVNNLYLLAALAAAFVLGTGIWHWHRHSKADRLLAEAETFFYQGFYEQALPLLKQHLHIKSDNYQAYGILADIYYVLGKEKDARYQIRKLGRVAGGSAVLQRLEAKQKLLAQQYDEAIKLYRDVLGYSPGDSPNALQAIYELAVAYTSKGMDREARKHVDDILRTRPDHASALFIKGVSCGQMGETAREIDHYLQVIALNDRFPQIHLYLGAAYFNHGTFERAIQEFEEVLKESPDDPSVHFNIALSADSLGRMELAEKHYLRVIELQPDTVEARLNLGVLYGRMGKADDEIGVYKEILKIDPENPDIYFNTGITYYHDGKHRQAADMFQKTVHYDSQYVNAYFYLGLINRTRDQLDRAASYFKKVLQLEANHMEALSNLCELEGDRVP